MSIRIRALRKAASFVGAPHPLFDGLDFDAADGARVGVLGAAKSGKSTLLRVMCGTEMIDGGAVERTSRVSWPMPLSSFLSQNSTVAVNARFIARLYGVNDDGFARRVAQLVEIADFLNVPLKKCPQFVKQRLPLALGIGMEFDIYLFDGSLTPVDKPFKERAAEIVAGQLGRRGFVLASATPNEAERDCESVYVLEAGRAEYFADVKAGVKHFKEFLKEQKQKQELGMQGESRSVDAEDGEGPGDIDLIGGAVAAMIE